jgi:hypothetical protein
MSTAHDTWTDAEQFHDASPINLLLPGVRFMLFALMAILAGAVLAFLT